MVRILIAFLASFLALGQAVNAQSVVSGTATFRERIAIAPGATFTASLLDVSQQDVAATELGTAVIDDAGNPPYVFEIPYDPRDIDPAAMIVVRAELRQGEKLLFTTDTAYPVITRGAGAHVDLIMIKVPAASPSSSEAETYGLKLPQTFKGVLPCADCEGIRHHVDLWEDGVFHMRRTWMDGGKTLDRDDIGRWLASSERPALILQGGAEAPIVFDVVGPETLRATDVDGNSIVSDLPYDLVGTGSLEPTDIQMFLNGEVIYMADAMVFEECLTGRTYPVAQERDYLPLERAYLDGRSAPGAPLLAVIEGQVTPREGMEGGSRPHVVVDRFIRIAPDLTCERNRADVALGDGLWKILTLDGTEVIQADGAREPRLTILEDGTAWGATVGCNQMRGSLTLGEGGAISFGPGAATMMACPPTLDALERSLSAVLGSAERYQISGQTLELYDADGTSIAMFEALALP